MPVRKKTGVAIPPPKAAVPVPVTGFEAAATPPSHPVPFIKQEQTQWCWAACTAMIAAWLRPAEPHLKQCALAGILTGRTDCCSATVPKACNQPCKEVQVLPVYKSQKINGIGERNPLSQQELLFELSNNGPVEVGYYWFGGGGHVAVVYGVTAAGLFAVHDPWFGSGFVRYTALRAAYGRGLWGLSFGQFKLQG